jgi:hypothetical protein
MEPGDCAVELFLRLRVTGDNEVYPSKLFRRVVLVRVLRLVSGLDASKSEATENGSG